MHNWTGSSTQFLVAMLKIYEIQLNPRTMVQNCECKSWTSISIDIVNTFTFATEKMCFGGVDHQIVVKTLKYQAVLHWHHSLNWKLLLVYMWWLLYLAFNMSVLSALWSFCSWLCQKLSFYYYTLLNHFSAFQWQIIFSAIACSLKLIIGCWQFHQIMVVILHMSHLN